MDNNPTEPKTQLNILPLFIEKLRTIQNLVELRIIYDVTSTK